MNGFVVYEGPSRLDSEPVVLVVTLSSLNTKTGDIPQAWVLRADVSPSEAIQTGRDRSICGDCVHRSGTAQGRSCYVIWWQGPLKVYDAYRRSAYARLEPLAAARELRARPIRIAAYGDPAAIPFDVWRELLVHAAPAPSYTHQWRTCDQRFRSFCMASVESEGEVAQAHQLGWRTFRTRLVTESARPDEIVCPASDEAGHRLTCEHCALCVGQRRPTARSVVIIAHGLRTSWFQQKKVASL